MASGFGCTRGVAKEPFNRNGHDAVQAPSVSGRITTLQSMDLFCRINTLCCARNTLVMDLAKRASAHENDRSEHDWTRQLECHPEGLVRAGDFPTQAPAQRTWIRGREILIGLLRAGACTTPAMSAEKSR